MKPYKEYKENNYYIRIFDEKTNSEDFVWHRDNEDRIVIPLETNDWKLQLDNSLPQNLDKEIFIDKLKWHRLIKGTGILKIKLFKLK